MLNYWMIIKQGDREYSQDFVGSSRNDEENKDIFVLADGLGGMSDGEIASKTVVNSAIDRFNMDLSPFINREQVKDYSLYAQSQLQAERQKQNNTDGMLSTGVICLIKNNKCIYTHVGDSRLYIISDGEYTHTKDHSIPWRMYENNEITIDEVRGHILGNKLYSVFGDDWSTYPSTINEVNLKHSDAVLLCSDGVWGLVTEDKMIELLCLSSTPKQWLTLIEKEIIKNGRNTKMDNYSAIAIFYTDDNHAGNSTLGQHKVVGRSNSINRRYGSKNQSVMPTTQPLERMNTMSKTRPINKKPKTNKFFEFFTLYIGILALIFFLAGALFFNVLDELQYIGAVRQYENGEYEKAANIFSNITDYKNSDELYDYINTNHIMDAMDDYN